MNESCTQTQAILYTKKLLAQKDDEHIASCKECQSLQSALNTVDTLYLVQEEVASPRFAKVMALQVSEVSASSWMSLTAIIDIISTALLTALSKIPTGKGLALGAICSLALIMLISNFDELPQSENASPSYLAYDGEYGSNEPDRQASISLDKAQVAEVLSREIRMEDSIHENKSVNESDFRVEESQAAGIAAQKGLSFAPESAPKETIEKITPFGEMDYDQPADLDKERRDLSRERIITPGAKSALQMPKPLPEPKDAALKRKATIIKKEQLEATIGQLSGRTTNYALHKQDLLTGSDAAPGSRPSSPPPITYMDPNGYWENTYLPGSPSIPLLVESLRNTIFTNVDFDEIMNTSGTFMAQHPMDSPLQGALGLSAHTDLSYLDKAQRVLLQVTIKGADRAKGNRPPLTIVVVIPNTDNIPVQERKIMEEILRALEAERRVDDHIAILTDEIEIPVTFTDFRYGTLELFLKNLTEGPRSKPLLPGGLTALYTKASTLALSDERTQLRERIILTLGHSGIDSLDAAYSSMDKHVLQGGIGSVLALNDNLDLMRLSARGQGSYRVLYSQLPTVEQVRAELESYGAVVARALRLNVQLQPGVKLKEIIGTNKLSTPEAEREKAVEVATDKRIAQSLGIETDRGKDDPGIQILIPRFLSGDSHIVILDLFVEQAGPIADISLKSKDLVLMRNETLHASAALPAFREAKGEIKTIIAHNEYAQRFASVIRMVRGYTEQGDFTQGIGLLQSFANDLENFAPSSNEKSNTLKLINLNIKFLQNMSQLGSANDVREVITGSLDVTSGKILGNPIRRNK